jgi:hypothetical protein
MNNVSGRLRCLVLGHIHLGMYIKGLMLICCEFIFNTIGHINLAILYTFTFQFERAHEVIDYNCALICAIIFVFGIWDAHRISIAMNKYIWLGSKEEDRSLRLSTITTFGINFMEKRTPWLVLFWSMIFPGPGHLYKSSSYFGIYVDNYNDYYCSKNTTGRFDHTDVYCSIRENYEYRLSVAFISAFGLFVQYLRLLL